MGRPVVHFEVTGRHGQKLAHYYSELFGWQLEIDNPLKYGIVAREGNTTSDGVGIGGGVGQAPDGSPGKVTFYVEVPDIEATLKQAESLGGSRLFGPAPIEGSDIVLGQLADPEGHVIGLMQGDT
jgi:predicted enzyme related to lactoylglutathione lyase